MKLKGTQLIITTAAMLCIFALPVMATSMISVEPAYTEVWQGDEFTVNITVDSAEYDVYAASYTLYFNNTLLNATSLEKGPFLSQDGNPSTIQDPPTGIDNTAGEIKYGECRAGAVPGITGYGVLSTITFQVIGEEGISQLNLGDLNFALMYSAPPNYGPVPTTLNNGRVGIAQTQSPFVISGYIFNEDGSDCNNPAVNITNMDMGRDWMAKTNETSNYYQLTLSSCADVIAGEIIQFDATSPDGSQSNDIEHTVTLAEVDAGGFKYNATLRPPGDVNGDGEINSADATIVLRMAVCGEYNTIADVNHDNSITSLDALMILQVSEEL